MSAIHSSAPRIAFNIASAQTAKSLLQAVSGKGAEERTSVLTEAIAGAARFQALCYPKRPTLNAFIVALLTEVGATASAVQLKALSGVLGPPMALGTAAQIEPLVDTLGNALVRAGVFPQALTSAWLGAFQVHSPRRKPADKLPLGDYGVPGSDGALQAITREIDTLRQHLSASRKQELDRIIQGRRLVTRRGANPKQDIVETAYGRSVYDAFVKADAYVQAQAKRLRSSPLNPGQLTELFTQIHIKVGGGDKAAKASSPLAPSTLGKFRTTDVFLSAPGGRPGNMLTRAENAIVATNPYLDHTKASPRRNGTMVQRSIYFAPAETVEVLMRELDDWFVANQDRIPISELVSEIYFRLVSIHPMSDGNGRATKLLVDLLLTRAGVALPLWSSNEILLRRSEWPTILQASLLRIRDAARRALLEDN